MVMNITDLHRSELLELTEQKVNEDSV